MGRQINFYLLQRDFNELKNMLDKKGLILVNQNGDLVQKNDCENIVDEIYHKRIRAVKFFIKKADSELLYYSAGKFGMNIGELESEVIEFTIWESSGRERTFPIGRFYFVKGYFDENDNWYEKPAEYNRLYNQLRYYIRKNYIYSKKHDHYMGSYCYEQYRNKTDQSPFIDVNDDEWHSWFKMD